MSLSQDWFTHIKKVYKLFPLKKIYLIFLFFLIILVSIFELFGISLLIPLVTSLLDGENNLTTFNKIPIISDYDIFNGNTVSISILMISIFSIKVILSLLCESLILFLSFKSRALLRANMLKIYLNTNFIDLTKTNSSELINSIQSYTGQHRGTVLSLLKLFNEVLFLFFAFLFVILIYGLVSIIVIFVVLLFILIFDKLTKRYVYQIGSKVNKINSKVIKILSECFYGIKEVKIYKISEYYFNTLKEISLYQSKIETIYEILGKLPRIFFEYIIIVLFVLTGIFLYKQEIILENILPDITLIFFLILRLIPMSTTIANNIKTIRHNMNGVNKLFNKYNTYFIKKQFAENNNKLIDHTFQSIELKNVKFQYPTKKDFIFENVNLKVNRGDFVGITGESGAGKTTLVDLILGILKPMSGEILYNNKKISLEEYSSGNFAAYLPQNNFIIDDTIEKNIALDHYKNRINYQRLNTVLKKANLISLVDSLPNKTKTILGEHGRFLSGGQRQRVAIARALYFNKNLIILDESTNAMDKNLEKTIINELVKLKDDLAVIIITHNTENLIYCNKVFNIEKKILIENRKYKK